MTPPVSPNTVWVVFSGSNRSLSATWLEAVTTDRENARLRMVAIMREREEWAGPTYPITWESDLSATREGHAGWGFHSSGGDSVCIQEWPVVEGPRPRRSHGSGHAEVERRLADT